MRIVAGLLLGALICLVGLGLPSAEAQVESADTIFRNGNVYTVNDRLPHAEAIGVKGSRITFVGSNLDSRKLEGPQTKIIDLQGATVVPGLTDAHYHLSGVGLREMTLNLEGTSSLADFLAKVKLRVDQTKPGAWVTGRGWIETFWKPQKFPTRQDLDRISPNNPVYLVRADGHGGIANSAALKLAGITKDSTSPFGGEIMKDKQTGEPTGMLLDRAQGAVQQLVPRGGNEEADQALIVGSARSVALGWCQIQNAGGNYNDVERLDRLYKEGKIKLRVYQAIHGPSVAASRLIKEGPIIGAFENRFTLRDIKVVFDGALGSKGAALIEPYSDYDSRGLLTAKEEEVYPMLVDALRAGIQVETHAIGDRANRVILDLYEKALKEVPAADRKVADPRWRVEHAQILQLSDIPRFARLGIIPSMQPSHAIGDLHFAPSRLGMKRLEGAYAWQSLIKTGVVIAGGSDAPVERGEPMIEFYAAVSRRDLRGFTAEGWHPEQAVTREQALKMFTIWAAYAAFEDQLRGSIEVGKLADLTVLSADIMKIAEREIPKTQNRMTVINGEVAYQAAK
jgi:predicted amidohydrolase YtcJ